MVESLNIQREFEKASIAKKAIYGLNQTLRALKNKNVEKIVYAKNAPESVVKEVEKYAKEAGAQIIKFDGDSKELAIILKRNHSVMISSIIKG